MTTAPNNLPPGGYVHREPSALRKALPWIIGVVVLALIGWLGAALVDSLKDKQKSFSIYYVDRGWVRFLLFLLAASGVLALTSLLGQRIGMARTGRRISYAAVLGDQLTHLFLILVVLIAIYPLFYVLIAAFDPRNSLFAFPDFGNPNIFYKTGLLPDLKQLNLENFAKLFEGVTIPAWQLLLAVIGGAALAAVLISLIVSKVGRDTDALANVRAWGLRVLVAALAVLVIFMGPAQFTGGSNESKFLLSVRNTLLVSGLTGVLAILLSTTAGYAKARLRFPGR